jgi:hypothetical protein
MSAGPGLRRDDPVAVIAGWGFCAPAGIGTSGQRAYSRSQGEVRRERPLTDEHRDCRTILQHIVEAYMRVGKAAVGPTWDYGKARDALRAAVDDAQRFLNDDGESASEVPILREVDSPP